MREMAPGHGFVLLGDTNHTYRHRSTWIRRWREGDHPACAITRKARGIPCGPPVAVVLVQHTSSRPDRTAPEAVGGRYRSLCPLHLPFAEGAAELANASHGAALDRLVQQYPDDFKRYLDDEVQRRRKTATDQAMRELSRFFVNTEGTR
ncbi:hypothetical protein SAMN05421874_12864 [Nonomuraea maritima]|uniref:Uncharacterized protein n=1 Tax=Nonomuraea maritima TaxID=683260 RepID=A0A1G9MJ94_9ACTN|nr:hypothetical protein [Nonomuraea maritima]SDL74350.1 hypothetical protein SAMN05421874_12864 [Nonomuraea maritima]